MVAGIFTTLLIANIFMAVIQFGGIRLFVKILDIPNHFLLPILIILSVVGSFALRNNSFDVGVTIVLGLIGYFMSRGGFPMAPVVLGVVLGPMLESELRRSLIMSRGDWSIFYTRPITLFFLILSLMIILSTLYRSYRSFLERKGES